MRNNGACFRNMTSGSLVMKSLFLASVILFVALSVYAADVITDGDMELAGIVNWPHTDITGTNSSTKATDQSASGQSLKGTSLTGRGVGCGWYNDQTVGTINSTDTVNLSFWYGYQFNISSSSASGTLYVDAKPSSGTWAANSFNLWNLTTSPSTAFQSGTVTNQDVSALFTVDQSYDIRVRFEGTTGRDWSANIFVWWDDVVLNVVSPVCNHAAPTVDVINTTAKTGCTGDSITYDFTVTSNCSGSGCGNETFNLSYADSAGNFTSSGPASVVLAAGATSAIQTLTVDILAGASGSDTSTITATPSTHTGDAVSNTEAVTTVDLTAPGSAIFTSCTPVSDSQIDLAWTNPGDGDFQNVIIVRGPAGGACPTFSPVDGNIYSTGAQGTDTIVYVGNVSPFSDTGLLAGTNYCYEIWAYDNCGNYATFDSTSCVTIVNSGDVTAPTIMVVSPTQGAVLGGTDRIKIQIYDLVDSAPTVECSVDGGSFSVATVNTNYSCGTNCGIYEYDLNTTVLSNGSHFITVRATDSSSNISEVVLNFTVNNDGANPAGAGNLLRRTHGSQTCVDCHDLPTHSSQFTGTGYGTWAMDCLRCHTPHRTRNVYLVDETISTPNSGDKAVLLKTLSGAVGVDNSGVMGDASNTTFNEVCEVCHTKTTYFRNDGSQPDSNHNNASDCTSCHEHTKGFAPAGCRGCHNSPPSDASTGMKHQVHWDYSQYTTAPSSLSDSGNYSTTTYYRYGCGKCHYDDLHTSNKQTGTAGDPHVVGVPLDDTTTNPELSGTAAYSFGAPAGTENPVSDFFQYSYGTCSDVYCHGEFPGGVTTNDPVFNGTQNCTSCHIPDGGSHTMHVTTKGYDCQYCHESTVDAVPSIIDKSIHVDGITHWDLDEVNTILQGVNPLYNGTNSGTKDPPSAVYSTCNNVRCHSDGVASREGWSGTPAPAYQTPTWGGAPLGCDGCHGNSSATLTSGAHVTHLGGNAWGPGTLSCTDCHTSSAVATHVNGVVNFRDGNPLSTTTSCDNCHSTATVNGEVGVAIAKSNWHTPAFRYAADRCLLCHNTVDPASVNFDGTGGNATGKETYYGTVGHGLDSGTYTSTVNNAANLVCTTCHDNTTGNHIGGTTTDRLKTITGDALSYTDATSEFCLDCHLVGQSSAGDLGIDATNETTVHSGGVTNDYNTAALAPVAFPLYGDSADYSSNPGYQCIECHDPHGTSNYAMILTSIDGGLGSGSVTISASSGADLDPTTAMGDGVCDVCHTSGSADAHPDTSRVNDHRQGDTCVDCHNHDNSFKR